MYDFMISVFALIIGIVFYLTVGVFLIAFIFSGYLFYIMLFSIIFLLTYALIQKFLNKKMVAFMGTIGLYIVLFSLYTYYIYHTPPITSSYLENGKLACRLAKKISIKYPYNLDPCIYRILARDYRYALTFGHKEHLTEEEKKKLWHTMIKMQKKEDRVSF